jgi:hypothetical protein
MHRSRSDYATSRLTAANLEALQAQIITAQANGDATEEHRKAMCRVQKAGYEMGFVIFSLLLQKSRYVFKEWMEEHGH